VTKAQTFNFLKITLKYIDFGHGLLTSQSPKCTEAGKTDRQAGSSKSRLGAAKCLSTASQKNFRKNFCTSRNFCRPRL